MRFTLPLLAKFSCVQIKHCNETEEAAKKSNERGNFKEKHEERKREAECYDLISYRGILCQQTILVSRVPFPFHCHHSCITIMLSTLCWWNVMAPVMSVCSLAQIRNPLMKKANHISFASKNIFITIIAFFLFTASRINYNVEVCCCLKLKQQFGRFRASSLLSW